MTPPSDLENIEPPQLAAIPRDEGKPDGEDVGLPQPRASLHVSLLVLAVVVISLAMVLHVGDGSQVLLPGVGMPLPELCTFKRTSGVDCPGCGMTRSFISLAHGDFLRAWHLNPGGPPLFATLAFQIPYRALQLWRVRSGRRELDLHIWGTAALVAVGCLLMSQWFLRIGQRLFDS